MPAAATGYESQTPLKSLSLRQRVDRVFDDVWRAGHTYESRWQLIADYIRPTRYRSWESDANRGDRSFERILDATAPHASDIARSGLLAGLANPARPWFVYGLEDRDPDPPLTVVEWLTDFRDITLDVMRRSNFYSALETCFGDDIDFATGAFGIYEHPEKVIHCHDFPIGSYRLANDENGRVNTFARKVSMTAAQCVQRFGWESCSDSVRQAYERGNRQLPVTVRQLIAPNDDGYSDSPFAPNFPWKECYWEEGRDGASQGNSDPTGGRLLRESGYHELPVISSRWFRSDEDNHGTMSPGILALPMVKRLFQMERTGLNALEKMVDPPLKAPTSMMNRPISLQSGDISYYDVLQGNAGPEAMHDVRLPLDQLWLKEGETRAGIEQVYMVDLFLSLIGDARSQRPTAEEVRARMREKLQALGPIQERKAPETLGPAIDRIAGIMIRASMGAWEAGEDGIVPLPPQELQGRRWRVEYISEVAQAQKLIGLDGLERHILFGVQTATAVGDPSILDNIDFDDTMKQHADMMGVNPTVRRSADDREAIRQKRAEDQAAAQAAEAGPGLAQAAKDLSEADTERPSALKNMLASAGQ